MTGPEIALFAPLRDAYEASRRVRSPEDLERVLELVAEVVSRTLGWGGVVIDVHRRAWDDFETLVVHGSAGRRRLLGTTRTWEEWAPLLRDRYERRGAHFLAAGARGATAAWQPGDRLLVLMRAGDGDVTGVLSVDEPSDGRRPGDGEIDALVAVASAAGAALQQARESAAAARHQAALHKLLDVSTRITDARSDSDVLDAVCRGISDALGFERVAIELADAEGRIVPAASVGWEALPEVPLELDRFTRILRPEYESHGCFVIDRVDALRILDLPDSPYESLHNGRGPWAWHRHWLVVPLRKADGAIHGFIWVDEPTDFLLPDTPRLQALRLFADQAQAALESAWHYEQTLHMAQHDGLTGLPNRAVLLDRLQAALHRRRGDQTTAVLFVDIDRFKSINDQYGHDTGDEVLRAVALRIEGALRPGDTVARLGGDEFAVLCEGVADESEAVEVARRLRGTLSEPIVLNRRTLSVTASIGVALPVSRADDAQSLLHFADVAMYRVKTSGRDAEQVASAELRAGASTRAKVERALSGALGRGEVSLHWQPVVAVPGGRIVRAEALMRWFHPTLGPVPPLEFVPLAEDNGSIVELGRWALGEACRQWAVWHERFGDDAPGVAVNLSPRQLRDGGLRDFVGALLTTHRIPRGALTVEITEGVLLDASPVTIQTLAGLRRLGCAVELDDFGTGFSSLSSLADFNVDGLKIDRRFVSGGLEGRDAAIAEAVLAMARALDLRVTAEGVETDEQLAWLGARGCPQAQGFLFSRPVRAADLTALLATPRPAQGPAPAAASGP